MTSTENNDLTPSGGYDNPTADVAPDQQTLLRYGNGWTTTLRILAAVNTLLIALVLFYFLSAALQMTLFFAVINFDDSGLIASITVIGVVVAILSFLASLWVTLSLSPKPRVGSSRRFVALAAVIGGNAAALAFSAFQRSSLGAVVALVYILVTVQAWRSCYRNQQPQSRRLFVLTASLLMFLPLTSLMTGTSSITAAALQAVNGTVGDEIRASAKKETDTSRAESWAEEVWFNARISAIFDSAEVELVHVSNAAEEVDAAYDPATGLLTTSDGLEWYLCTTGPQQQACSEETLVDSTGLSSDLEAEADANRLWLAARSVAESEGTEVDRSLIVRVAQNIGIEFDEPLPDDKPLPGVRITREDGISWYTCETGPQELLCS
jgi:hypothetical protein